MGYIQDLEKELREKLGLMDKETLVKFFKEKVLESYRNGVNSVKTTKEKGRTSRPQTKTYGQA